MKKEENASISITKIICVAIIFVLMSGIAVMAGNTEIKNVKIILENGYEMETVTGKNIVLDILKENNIVLKENQKTIPDINSQMNEKETIKIVDESYEVLEVSNADVQTTDTSLDELLKGYAPITEKILIEQIAIPFETITKEVENATNEKTTSRIIKQGKDGLKEITYKVKYQEDIEVERTIVSEVVIAEPVDKIVQIQKVVTSRASTAVRTGAGSWSYSAAELDLICAITAQECSSNYTGALAVITTACNRAASARWAYNGSDPLSQLKAKGQFCYSIDSHWKKRLNGNYAGHVKQAVLDALNGTRNHNYLSFRAAGTSAGQYIGGNVYFNQM